MNRVPLPSNLGSDPSGTVEYYFDETSGNSGGTDSGWQTSPTYPDTGLQPETQYTYLIRMRDAAGNTGNDSPPASATTDSSTSGFLIQVDFENKNAMPVVGGTWNEIGAPSGTQVLKDAAGTSTGISIDSWINFGAGSKDEATDHDFSTTEWGESAQDSFEGTSISNTASLTLSGFSATDMVDIRLIAIENNRRDIDFQVNGAFGDGSSPFNGDDYNSRNAWDRGYVATWTGLTGTNSYTLSATPLNAREPVISAMQFTITPAAPPNQDTDGDGLPDSLEISIGTDPNKPDSDGDGLNDLAAYALQGVLPSLGNSPSGMVFNIPITQTSNILYSVEFSTSLTASWYRVAFKQPEGAWQKDVTDDDTPLYGSIDQITVNTNAAGVDVIDAESRPQGFYRPQFIYTP